MKEVADFIEPWNERFNNLEIIMKEYERQKQNSEDRKTKIKAENAKQDLMITREFDSPLELLFKAYAEADIVEQVMGTKVLKLESKKHGNYQFETTDDKENVVFQAIGVIHEFSPNRKITRTFEMQNAAFGAQLEIYEFEKLNEETSRLNIHVIYQSVAIRDRVLKLPLGQSINMAHNRLQDILKNLK